MDELDQRLLDELEHEGFQKANVLAAKVGAGERTVQRRLKHLRSKDIIKVVALPNPVLLGYKAWATLGINVAPKSLYDVTRELVRLPSNCFVAYSIGEFDILADVFFDSFDRLMFFVSSELVNIEGITKVETIPFIWPRKYYRFSWPAPVFQRSDTDWELKPGVAEQDAHQVDEIDHKIIGILRQDGLARLAYLKERLGMTESTIYRRIKKMFDKGFFSIEVVSNPESLRCEARAMVGIRTTQKSVHKLVDEIIKNPAVYFASLSLGRFSVVICARFRNMDLLNTFLKVGLPAMEGVTSIETFLYNRLLKYHNVDWSYLLKPTG